MSCIMLPNANKLSASMANGGGGGGPEAVDTVDALIFRRMKEKCEA